MNLIVTDFKSSRVKIILAKPPSPWIICFHRFLTESKQKFVLESIIKPFENSPRIYTFHFKRTNKEILQTQLIPPSFETRKNDQKYSLDFEIFKNFFTPYCFKL